MEQVEIIKGKYDSVRNKMDFLFGVAQKVKLNFFTIKNHHFGGKWNIPEKYHKVYIRELDKVIRKGL